jgi:hypothetical protein
MRRQAIILLVALVLLAVANAQDASSPIGAPAAGDKETDELALPSPEPDSQSTEPGLLPEAGKLPAKPPKTDPIKERLTAEVSGSAAETEARIEKARSIAMESPRALYLLKRAHSSSHSAARRRYLREYYATLADQMRRLDPELRSSINAYEESKIHEISGTEKPETKVSHHRSGVRHVASAETHHKNHRLSSEYRYRRRIIVDDPYGPAFYPFGPPVMYAPW